MKQARIEFLETTYGNDKGDVVKVIKETESDVYYNDGFRRWCYLKKSEEGIVYLYIPAGTRLNSKKGKSK